MKIAAVVILYNPDDSVIKNIASYAFMMHELLVIDNSEEINPALDLQLKQFPSAILIQDGKNEGIASRLNQAANYFHKLGYDWLLTMDQDSFFQEKQLKNYLQCIEAYPEKGNLSMAGINYIEKNSAPNCSSKEVCQLITSGSIINLQIFTETDSFDEALFIDEVDLDFCYNSISKGFKIIQFQNIHLEHSLGNKSRHTSLRTFKYTDRTLHSPIRIYYMIRNFFYVNGKYPNQFKDDKRRRGRALLNRIKNNLLYSERKLSVAYSIFSGYSDFIRKKMGKKR